MSFTNSVDHAYSLDQYVLNPFPIVGPSDINNTNHSYENIRTTCKYYNVPAHCGIGMSSDSLYAGKFTIIHVNARSILSEDKFSEFEVFLCQTKCKWSIICVSETWLCPEMEDKRKIKGYTNFFDSRVNAIGGGVAIYVNNDAVKVTHELPKLFSCTQSLLIECKLQNNLSILVCQVYKPPNLCNKTFLEELDKALERIQLEKRTVFISGDFNIDLLDIPKGGAALDFLNITTSSGFLPLISKSTRVQNSCHSLIDNIFCNNIALISTSGILLDDTGDHFPIFAVIGLDPLAQKANKIEILQRFNFHKIPDLINHLLMSLEDFENISHPENACDRLISAYTSGIEKFSFKYTPTRKNTPIRPWISPCILASIEHRCKLFKIKLNNPTEENISIYVKYRNILNTLIRNAKEKYINDQLEASKHDTKKNVGNHDHPSNWKNC